MILIPPLSLALPSFLSLPVTRHVFNLPTMKIIISNYLYSPSYIYYEVNLLLTFTLIKHSFVSKMTTNIHVTQFSASKLSIDMKFIWSTSKRFFFGENAFSFLHLLRFATDTLLPLSLQKSHIFSNSSNSSSADRCQRHNNLYCVWYNHLACLFQLIYSNWCKAFTIFKPTDSFSMWWYNWI